MVKIHFLITKDGLGPLMVGLRRKAITPCEVESSMPSGSIMIYEENLIEANFITLEDNGKVAMLECPRCGIEFDVHIDSEKNMIFLWCKMAYVACCPLCATVQKS